MTLKTTSRNCNALDASKSLPDYLSKFRNGFQIFEIKSLSLSEVVEKTSKKISVYHICKLISGETRDTIFEAS